MLRQLGLVKHREMCLEQIVSCEMCLEQIVS